jgi:acetyl esterase/lipase
MMPFLRISILSNPTVLKMLFWLVTLLALVYASLWPCGYATIATICPVALLQSLRGYVHFIKLDLTHSQPSFRLENLDVLPNSIKDWIVPGKRSHHYTLSVSHNSYPYVSPFFSSDKLGHLPKTLIHVGENERLRDESLVFCAERFPNSPIRLEMYANQVHVFQSFNSKASTESYKRIGRFIKDLDLVPGIYKVDSNLKTRYMGKRGAISLVNQGRIILENLANSHQLLK